MRAAPSDLVTLPRRRRLAGDRQTALLGILLLVTLAVLVLPPLYLLFQGAVTDADGGFTTRNFASALGGRLFLDSLLNTLLFAAGSAMLALLIGTTNAWIVERTNTPLKGLAWLTAIISLGTPYVLYVGAWLLLLGKAGPVNQLWREWTGGFDPLVNVYSLPGMILVEGLLWSPLVFLLIGASLRSFNPELEEAARMSGAGLWRTIRRITMGLSLPAILALAMLVFIRAFEAFEVPALVGMPGRVYVLTTDIYQTMRSMPPDFGSASAFSVVMLGIVLLLLVFYGRLSRHAERFATVTGKGFRARPFDIGRWRWPAAAILIVNFLVLLVLPTAMLVWASLLPFYQPLSRRALGLLTFANYRTVFAAEFLPLATNTMLVGLASASAVMLLTLFAAWLSVRRARGGWTVERLAMAPLVFPGIVLGVAVMQIFLRVPIPIYGTLWILVWAFVISYLPYGMRYSGSGMLQIHRELEEVASISGASPLTRLRRIVMPLLAPSLLAGWLFIFLLVARALSLPILLAGARSQTMAVAMYDLWSNGQGTELAALGLLWTGLMAAIALIFYMLTHRSQRGAAGHA